MQDALNVAAPALANVPRGTDEDDIAVSVRLTAVLLDRVGSATRQAGFDAHEAVLYMTEALWDVDTAMDNVLAQQAEDRATESDKTSMAATSHFTECYADEEEIVNPTRHCYRCPSLLTSHSCPSKSLPFGI